LLQLKIPASKQIHALKCWNVDILFFSFTVGIRFHEHQFLEAMDCLHEFRYRPKLGDLPPKWGCGKGSWNFFAS
jgi:hypothetical protein